jgi:hypothetical protein
MSPSLADLRINAFEVSKNTQSTGQKSSFVSGCHHVVFTDHGSRFGTAQLA